MNKIKLMTIGLIICGLSYSQQPEEMVGRVVDQWHEAAARADFNAYFSLMTEDAVFIGTDATEYWKGEEFRKFSQPYFDRGKAWTMNAEDRHIYFNQDQDLAWFDELLDTRMGLCRGSGILLKEAGSWKIAHYVLSLAVPNENVDALVSLKKETDSLLLISLKKKP